MDKKAKLISEIITDLSLNFNTVQLTIIRETLIRALNNYDLDEHGEETALMTVDSFNDDLLKKYLVNKTISGISEKSIKQYVRETRKCLAVIDKRAVDITPEDLQYYFVTYKARYNIANTSMYNMVNYINNFFRFLVDEDYITKNPMRRVPKIKRDTIPEGIFSKKEEERLYLACKNLRDRALLEFFISTGCRVSEVCNIKITDIDFSTKKIRVIGKGNKLRIVYIDDKALLHLERYLKDRCDTSEFLFVSNRKPYGQLSREGIETMMKRVGKVANVANVHPHRFRATFCTRMIDRGTSLHIVQKLMGHSSIQTTMKYYRGTGNIKSEFEKYTA